MSVAWWLLIAYVVGVFATVVPFAKATRRSSGYYCAHRAMPTSRPCPDGDYWHRRCGPREPGSIGASAVGQAMFWPVVLVAYSFVMAWSGLTGLVGRAAGTGRVVDRRRLSELERELGIDDA